MSAAALTLCPVLAHAQDATTAQTWVGELIVTGAHNSFAAPVAATATRTATPVEEIPQSIQILTRTLIDEQDLQNISNALVNVSGVTPSSTMQIVLQAPLIRGFAVNYYYDGLPAYGLPAGITDPATLINAERIEVAKGPASTLYGGGAGAPLSGLINIVSRRPGPERRLSLGVRGGSFDTLGGDADLNLPLADGRLGLRLTGMYEAENSYIHVADSRRYAYFPTLAWTLSPKTRLTVRGQVNHLEQREYSGLPAEQIGKVDRFAFAGAEDAPRTIVDNNLVTAILEHSFSDAMSAEISVRRYTGHSSEISTFPVGLFGGSTYFFGSGQLPSSVGKTFATASLVRRVSTGAARHQLLIGADYDQTRYAGAMGLDFGWGVVDYAHPTTNAAFGAAPAISDLQNDRLNSSAVYLQDQIAIGDRLDVTAGVRWTRMHVTSRYTSFGFPFADTDETYNRMTPRLGATFKAAEGVSLFAGYAAGFQGVVAFVGAVPPVPETSQSFEAGLKFASPIKGLTGSASLFQIARQHAVRPDPANPGFSIQTGEQRARGLETDLVYEPSRSVSLLFNYAYTDATVTHDDAPTLVGDKLRAVPRQSARLAARYRFLNGAFSGLEFGGGVTAVSRRELTLPNTTDVAGSVLVDAQAAYDFGRISLSLSVVNLTGVKAFEPYQYFAGAYVAPVQPRSAYVTLRTTF